MSVVEMLSLFICIMNIKTCTLFFLLWWRTFLVEWLQSCQLSTFVLCHGYNFNVTSTPKCSFHTWKSPFHPVQMSCLGIILPAPTSLIPSWCTAYCRENKHLSKSSELDQLLSLLGRSLMLACHCYFGKSTSHSPICAPVTFYVHSSFQLPYNSYISQH